jgi:hypothetical protein
MNAAFFPPDRQRGLVIHISLFLVLALIAGLAAWQAFKSTISVTQTVLILVTALAFFPLPFIAYRTYALIWSNYALSRETLRLQWGLRVEEIPLSNVEWVRPVGDLASPLRLPVLHLPGSVMGVRRQPDLGLVEFLASNTDNLLLVATAKRIFAISPADPAAFTQNFARSIEMGSLSPMPARSVYPSFVMLDAWQSPLARYFWIAGLLLNIGLLVWVSLQAPTLPDIPLGFTPTGAPLEPVSGVQLILLPVISFFLFFVGWVAGLYFYRRPQQKALSFILWGSGTLTALLFLFGVLFILTTPV